MIYEFNVIHDSISSQCNSVTLFLVSAPRLLRLTYVLLATNVYQEACLNYHPPCTLGHFFTPRSIYIKELTEKIQGSNGTNSLHRYAL